MASLYPVYGEMAAKAYVQAGEICLNYRLNATYGEEVNGYLPPTRARCTSGQYRIFNDQLQLGICLRLSPAGMGKYIVDVLKPILEKLPGNLYETIGPGMAGWIARKVGKALDKAFSQGLFLPIIGPILGLLYETAMVIMKNWFSVDLRNLLTNDDPAKNVRQYSSAMDMAIDASQDRMARVYWKKDKCNDKVTKAGTGCPEAIPIRAAYISNVRAGDYTDSAFSTLWAGRKWSKTHTRFPLAAYLKSGLCLKVPICDTELYKLKGTRIYSKMGGESLDCSSHGLCVWNMAKGNHCKCDPGYEEVPECMKCCKPTDMGKEGGYKCGLDENGKCISIEERMSREFKGSVLAKAQGRSRNPRSGVGPRHQGGHMSKERIQKAADNFHREDAALALTREALRLEQAAVKKGKKAERTAQPKIEALKAAANATRAGVHSIMDSEDDLGESGGNTDGKDKRNGFTRWRQELTDARGFTAYGPQFISARCKGRHLDGTCINTLGCHLATIKTRQVCVDAADFRCTVQKRIIDCMQALQFTPLDVQWFADSMCGHLFLKRKFETRKFCSRGVRMQEWCNHDKDCPLSPAEIAMPVQQGDKSPYTSQSAGKVKDGPFRGKRNAYAKCREGHYAKGCNQASLTTCSGGLDTIVGMFA